MKNRRKRLSREEKDRIVAGYRASGRTQQEYAKAMGVGLSTLGLWLRRGGQERKPRLLEVDVTGRVGESGFYRMSLAHGTRLEIGRGFEATELRTLLRILKEEL